MYGGKDSKLSISCHVGKNYRVTLQPHYSTHSYSTVPPASWHCEVEHPNTPTKMRRILALYAQTIIEHHNKQDAVFREDRLALRSKVWRLQWTVP